MDTMEEYAKMCNCPEIQESREYNDGDIFYYSPVNAFVQDKIWICGEWKHGSVVQYDESDLIYFDGGYEYDTFKLCHAEDAIWLPRQDQLQEMLKWKSYELIYKFNDFCRGGGGMYGSRGFFDINGYDYSMEQLWLTFVVFELHQKKWNGEAWVTPEMEKAEKRFSEGLDNLQNMGCY